MTQITSRMGRSGSRALSAAVSAVLATASGVAVAQTEAPPPETALGEVIVTATRRAERLQDVSESISAFDSTDISMRGLQNMDDVVKYIPGMSLAQREPGGTTLVFRGVASSGVQFGAISSSALYLDEQPITQSGRSPDPRLIDIERIEALRGPQGSLYGASSQSGTLRVITAKPDPSGFDSWVEGQVTNTEDGGTGYDVSAMVNLPLNDRLALRLVGFSSEDAGFIDNVLSDSQGGTFTNENVVDEDVNSVTTVGGRGALRWDVSDSVDVTLAAIFQDVDADGHGDLTIDDSEGVDRDLGDLQQVRFEDESLDDRWYQFALTVNAELPFADAVFSASYFDRDFRYEADASDYEFRFNQTAIIYDSPNYDFGGDPRGFATNAEQTEITTVEARLQSKSDSSSRWGWLAGAFYSNEKQHTEFDSFVRDYQDSPAFAYFSDVEYNEYENVLAPTETWFLGRYDTELEQIAVFGELSFDVTENFTITAGGRWFEYDRGFIQHQESPQGFSGFTLLDDNQRTKEDGTVAKLNLTYRIDDDRMVYATWSEGFRVGGSNPLKAASILPRDYSSDELENYELGAKTEWLDNRLRFNLAVYHMKWKDFAVQIEDPQSESEDPEFPPVFQLGYVNLPSAEIDGVEAEFAMTLSDQWQLEGAVGWNDGQIAEATTLELVREEDGSVFEFSVSDGARLPLTPDWSASLGLEFRPRGQLLNAQPFARFDYAYVGESINSLEGIESVVSGVDPVIQEAYQTGDFRVGLEGEHWSTSLFVDNVWNERADLFLSNRWAVQRKAINRPRTIGLQFRYDF